MQLSLASSFAKSCSFSITKFRRVILLSLIILNIVFQISPTANALTWPGSSLKQDRNNSGKDNSSNNYDKSGKSGHNQDSSIPKNRGQSQYDPSTPNATPPTPNVPNQDNSLSKKYYYGKDFQKFTNPYQVLKKDHFNSNPPETTAPVQKSELRLAIQAILQKWHKIQPNDYDVIDSSCDGHGCYKHTSIGYDGARKFLLGKFYLVKRPNGYAVKEVYCSKEYTSDEFKSQKPGPDIIPDHTVVNVEHTWPQSKFSTKHPTDEQKADLHHLYPSDTKLNSIRGNNPFGEVSQDQEKLKCVVSRFGLPANGRNQVFEPPEEHKGHVARALFYFAVKYDKMIDSAQEETLRKWSKDHPVDETEILRNDVIYRTQGSRNPFVDYPELIDQISDF